MQIKMSTKKEVQQKESFSQVGGHPIKNIIEKMDKKKGDW